MDTFLTAIGGIIMIALLVLLAACFSGIVLYFLWPFIIPVAFPRLVADGWLVASLTLKQSIALCWVFGILIKSSQTNNNKKD